MAKTKATTQRQQAHPEAIHKRLHGVLYQYGTGICVLKTLREAAEQEGINADLARTLDVAIDLLDRTYNEFDLSLIRLSNEGAKPEPGLPLEARS